MAIRISEKVDKTNKTRFFVIVPDLYNKHAENIYNLVTHNQEPYNNSSGIAFYFEKTDSSRFLYNYFRSASEALQYMAENNWELLSVTNEILSDHNTTYANNQEAVYTTVTSRAVFYFKKEIE